MSALKQRLARIGATAGVLAVTTAAIMAVGGATASSALAVTCPGTVEATSIQGRGSSLQRIGQEQWTGRKVPTTEGTTPYEELAGPIGYARTVLNGGCHEAPVSYTSTSSGSGLTAFRFNGTGSILTQFAFIGSDDGPQRAQIENAEAATSGTAKPLIIPVAETAIAVDVHPPAGCEFVKNKKGVTTGGITWTQLNEIFAGTMKTWAGLGSQVTGTCTGAITRVVRKEGSGTSTQFKNYLSELQLHQGGVGPCSSIGSGEWSNLLNIGPAPAEEPNTVWPETTNCGVERTAVVRAAGGGKVAEEVKANPGYIGYSALPDTKSKEATPALLQDEEVGGSPFFASSEGASEASNCGSRQYTVPKAEGTEPGGREGESGEGVNWFKVFGAAPTVGGGLYPLCTLTYDVAWNHYANAGYTEGAMVAKNVHSYLEYVLTTGQSVGHWYQALPQPETPATGAPHNVLGAAKLALSHIG